MLMNAHPSPTITLYTAATPNGIKISMALEVLGLPYKVHQIDLSTGVQKQPWFLAINPNGRIPALTDTSPDGGPPIHIFESGSILLYLVERYDKFWARTTQGQANHFRRYAPEEVRNGYALTRYQTETRRLYAVLEAHLGEEGAVSQPFLVGGKATIADLSVLSWVLFADWAGVEIAEFPRLKRWEERMCAIPGVVVGTEVPKKTLGLMEMSAKDKDEYATRAASWIVPT